MYYLILTIILFAQTTTHTHAYNSVQTLNNYTLISHNPQARLSHNDKKIAHNFNSLLRLSQRQILNKRLLRNLEKQLANSDLFKSLSFWPKEILKIQNTQDVGQIHSRCDLMANKQSDGVQAYLLSNLIEICYKKFLNKLSERQNRKQKLISYHSRLLEDSLPRLWQAVSSDHLVDFFQDIKPSSSHYTSYSRIFTKFIVDQEIVPTPKLIKQLILTPAFTAYIQTKEIEPNTTHSIFYKVFTNNTQEIRDEIDNSTKSKKLDKFVSVKTHYLLKFYKNNSDKFKARKISYALLALGKSLNRRDYPTHARLVFKTLLKQKTYFYDDALFEYVWTYVGQKNYHAALQAMSLYGKQIDLDANSKLSFWKGYLNSKLGRTDKANKIYSQTIYNNPLSYYSILSAKQLSENSRKSPEQTYLSALKQSDNNGFAPKDFDYLWLRRIQAWSYVGSSSLLNSEFQMILHDKKGQDLEVHILSAANKLKTQKNYLESFKFIYRTIDQGKLTVNKETLKILFPSPFLKQIQKNSKEFDPLIALALIRQESGFNERARSHVGARGLMQLMPGTARRFKRVRNHQLYNPNLNIKIGTTFFTKLMDHFDNNLVYSLAAYNAGKRRIDDWREKNYVNSQRSMLDNIENIPFLETRKYVKLIFRNVFFYKLLSDDHNLKDSGDFNKIFDIHVGFKN